MLTLRTRLTGVVALSLSVGCATAKPALKEPNGATGQQIKLVAQDLQGSAFDIGADQGKVRLVNFWATWCTPCIEEMPFLSALQEQYGTRGFQVYGISVDEDRNAVPSFIKSFELKYPVLWDKGGEKLVAQVQVMRLPTTLLVDKTGIIRYVHQGFYESLAREERKQIEQLLAE